MHPIIGTWDVRLKTPIGTLTATYVFVDAGDRLAGTASTATPWPGTPARGGCPAARSPAPVGNGRFCQNAAVNELELFRAAAREDMSDEDIAWWLRLARPCLHLERGGDGPVVGHFGGRPALPASVAWPAETVHLASVDLAAIPRDTLDLGLPADGTLVFFSKTHIVPDGGHVLHVPAGTAVTEAEPPAGTPSVYDRFPLRATPDWSLPECADDSPLYVGERREDQTIFEFHG
ncbi:hypothetical protein [Micromonospora sp. DT233]|uniref:hypothetical protein n=1 Tax=Micromonospora sp. DT233 TaxID=3393432 RepID=UPI003CF9071F